MKFKSIAVKLSFWSGLCLILSGGGIVGFSFMNSRDLAIQNAKNEIQDRVRGQSSRVSSELITVLEKTRSLARVLAAVKDEKIGIDISRSNVNGILQALMEGDEKIVGVFTCWEPDAFDDLDIAYGGVPGHDDSGRLAPHIVRTANGSTALSALSGYADESVDQNGIPINEFYTLPRETHRDYVSSPLETDGILLARLTVPILVGESFFGIVGLDVNLNFIQADLRSNHRSGSKEHIAIRDSRGILVTAQAGIVEDIQTETTRNNFQTGERILVSGSLLKCYSPITITKDVPEWNVFYHIPLAAVTAQASEAAWHQIWMGASLILAALVFLGFISRSVSAPIRRAADTLLEIAEGEGQLTILLPEDGRDEIFSLASGFNRFVGKLDATISTVSRAVGDMDTTAKQISTTSEDLRKISVRQSSSLGEISSSLVEIESVLSDNQQKVRTASEIAEAVFDCSTRGVEQMESLSTTIKELEDSSERVFNIIALIENIAFQTNLLALNAAVAAARAGDVGAGFAVVADEVRSLAGRCARAASDTSGIIAQSNELVKAGASISAKVSQSLLGISDSSREFDALMGEIKSKTERQNSSIRQVACSVGDLEGLSQSNERCSNQLATVAQAAEEQASVLLQMVGNFKCSGRIMTPIALPAAHSMTGSSRSLRAA